MLRRMIITGALIVAVISSVLSLTLAPTTASTSGLADKVSAASVLDGGDVPLYRTMTNAQQEGFKQTIARDSLRAIALREKRIEARAAARQRARALANAQQATTSPPPQTQTYPSESSNVQRGYYLLTHDYSSWGWYSSNEWNCLVNLWNRESGWNQFAKNPYSEAYGIPQANPGYKMASAGSDWQWNPWTQIRWGLGYIHSTYGSPCSAWDHEISVGYYAVSAHPLINHAKLMSSSTVSIPRRLRAYRWALRHAKGCWYYYGGSSCSPGYDCSGLVMRAYDHVGIYLPHNTQAMVDSGHLVRIWHRENIRKGDVVMYFGPYGAYHTGLVAYRWKWMLDASTWGQRIGIQRIWGSPVFYRVRKRT